MKTVLVIEDDLPLCWLLEKILGSEYFLKVFNNGFDAWYWLREGNSPDLIITDIKMPGMDGLELLENLRLSALFKRIPVVILSGYEDPFYEAKGAELGISAYVSKPFEPNHLADVVREVIERVEMPQPSGIS